MADEMAQGGQVSQTRNAASPDRLNATAILHLNESLQVLHQGIGKPVHGENQPVIRHLLTVHLLSI